MHRVRRMLREGAPADQDPPKLFRQRELRRMSGGNPGYWYYNEPDNEPGPAREELGLLNEQSLGEIWIEHYGDEKEWNQLPAMHMTYECCGMNVRLTNPRQAKVDDLEGRVVVADVCEFSRTCPRCLVPMEEGLWQQARKRWWETFGHEEPHAVMPCCSAVIPIAGYKAALPESLKEKIMCHRFVGGGQLTLSPQGR